MPQLVFGNLLQATVVGGGNTAPTPGTTETWVVSSAAGWPAVTSTGPPATHMHIIDPTKTGELIDVLNMSGAGNTTWLVTRGAESTTPVAHGSPFTIYNILTAGDYEQLLVTLDTTASDIQPSPGTRAAGSAGEAADAGHVHGQPPMFAPTGLTGATQASRYVGATASGRPVSGTFTAGDWVIDKTGTIWVCVTGGTPGSWTQVVGGSGSTPGGAAGGDLSGTYPNPGVAKIDGIAVTGTPSAGQLLTATGPTAADWQSPAPGGLTIGQAYALTLGRYRP